MGLLPVVFSSWFFFLQFRVLRKKASFRPNRGCGLVAVKDPYLTGIRDGFGGLGLADDVHFCPVVSILGLPKLFWPWAFAAELRFKRH